MEPVTKMWNSPIDPLWDGDEYFDCEESFVDKYLENHHSMGWSLPTEVWECKPTYFSNELNAVIEACLEEFEFGIPVEALSIGRNESVMLYYDVEDDCYIPELEGVEEFQKAIDRFCWWNFPIWSLFHHASWFKPERFSIGKYWLNKACDRFNQANHDQWTYEYDSKLRVELTSEFWEEWDNGTK